jgi:hypothetical protein
MYLERDHLEPDIVETEMSDFWKRSPEKLIIFHASSPPLYFPDIPRRLLIQTIHSHPNTASRLYSME